MSFLGYTLRALIEQGATMRDAQNYYFKSKSAGALALAKREEARFDKVLLAAKKALHDQELAEQVVQGVEVTVAGYTEQEAGEARE